VKYKIFKKEEAKEKPVLLKLVEEGRYLLVVAVDEMGEILEQGYLIRIDPKNGRVHIHDTADPKYRLSLK